MEYNILSPPSTTTIRSEPNILDQWNSYNSSALGRWLFSWQVGRIAPYSGSIKAQIISLKAGSALLSIKDRRSIRNHLNSIHAIALTNSVLQQYSSDEYRAIQSVQNKARVAGNGHSLTKTLNTVLDALGCSLRASQKAVIHVVALLVKGATIPFKVRLVADSFLTRCIHQTYIAGVLSELSSGLAMITALPINIRAIVVNLEIEFIKKARGKLTAEGSANPPLDIFEPIVSPATATIKDQSGDIVALITVNWLLAPKEAKETKNKRIG